MNLVGIGRLTFIANDVILKTFDKMIEKPNFTDISCWLRETKSLILKFVKKPWGPKRSTISA
jgi:hypothetical protein